MIELPTIVFDKQIFELQQYGGISKYFCKLINGLKKSNLFNVLPHNYFSTNFHLNAEHLDKYSLIHKLGTFSGKGRILNYINNKESARLKKFLIEGKFDIFHPTYYQDDFLSYFPESKPFVITIHDMIPEMYDDLNFKVFHSKTNRKSILIPKAAHIIAISDYTKNDILTLYPEIDPRKISVIYHGYSMIGMGVKKARYSFSNYILYVGNRKYYKNFSWMLVTIADFLNDHNILLVCAGGGDFTDEEVLLINRNKIHSRVLFIDIPNETALNELYSNAICFVFPSLYEGFGLPILEAFANNCPVILANASCFPEIARNAALYFEVNEPNSLILQLTRLLYERDLRYDLMGLANKRLENFSWEMMVDKHNDVYSSIVNP